MEALIKLDLTKTLRFTLLMSCCFAFGISSNASLAQSVDGQSDDIIVSTPEPTPNPVKDKVSIDNAGDTGGIDPELGTIYEPDNSDIDPVYRANKNGEWENGDDAIRSEIRKNAKAAVEQAEKNALSAQSAASNIDGTMPVLVGPKIPTIPINLLFPQDVEHAEKIERAPEIKGTGVLLTGLNRKNGTKLVFRVPVGKTVNYEELSIKVRACYKSNADEVNESWAYVDIIDNGEVEHTQLAVLAQRNRSKIRNVENANLKNGWIIASSPTVTAIDHPYYDVYLLSCEGGTIPKVEASKDSETQKKAEKAKLHLNRL